MTQVRVEAQGGAHQRAKPVVSATQVDALCNQVNADAARKTQHRDASAATSAAT